MGNVQKIVKQRTDVMQRKVDNLEGEREQILSRCARDENEKKISLSEIELLKEEIKHLKIDASKEKDVKTGQGGMSVSQGDLSHVWTFYIIIFILVIKVRNFMFENVYTLYMSTHLTRPSSLYQYYSVKS